MATFEASGVVVLDNANKATSVLLVGTDGTPLVIGGAGGTSSTDDGTFTPGASSVTPIGGIVTADSVDSGDVGALGMLTNRQLKVTLFDSAGNEQAAGGGAQYTEDAAAAANPVGNALILVRDDGRGGSLTNSDGDNVAVRGTNAGELYVKHVDAIPINDGGNTITVDGTVAVTNTGLTELAAAINGSSQMDVNIAASGATVPVSNTGLTELAAAINGSSQMDVNLAASNATVTVSNTPLSNAHSADYDTGAGTDTTTAFGLAVPASGGAVVVGGDASNGLDVDVTRVSGTVTVDGSGVTQPVSNAGLTELAAAINSSKVDVNIVTSDVSFGGGAQYTEGDTDASITGTAMLWEDTSDTLRAVSSAKPLPVAIISGAGSGGTAIADGAAFTADTTSLTPVGGYRDDTSPATVTEGDAAAARITEYRAIHVNLRDAGGNELSVGGGTQYTQGDTDASITGTAMLMEGAADTLLPVQGTVADGLLVNLGSNNDVAVTGTVTANLAAGTNNIGDVDVLSVPSDPFGANADAASATGSISAKLRFIASTGIPITGTVTVGSHAVTNAGTFVTQENGAALTALQLLDDTVTTLGTDTYTEATSKGITIGAVRRDADTTLVNTTNEFGPLQMDANGRLKVEAFSGETLPVSLASVPSHAVTNAGTFPVQVDGAALTALQLIDNPVLVDDAAFTPGTSSVMMAGFQADESSTDSVNEGDAGAARMTLDRKMIVTPQPHTAGGLSIFSSIDLDESEEEVKASAGCVYSIAAFNRTAAPLYLKLYDNTAAGTTVGSTTPIATFVVPANADSDGAGFSWQSAYGVTCATGITVAATTGVAVADTGAPGANDCVVVVTYA